MITKQADWVSRWLAPFSSRIEALPNGFDDTSTQKPPVFADYDVNIVFTGKVRDLFMLTWLMEFGEEVAKALLPRRVRLWVLGEVQPQLGTVSPELGLLGFLSHDDARRFQSSADLLLHVLSPEVEDRYQTISAKVFEYLGCQAPILAVGPASSLAGHLVAQEQRGLCVDSYEVGTSVAAAVDQLKRPEAFMGDRALLQERYSWASLRKQYASLLNSQEGSR